MTTIASVLVVLFAATACAAGAAAWVTHRRWQAMRRHARQLAGEQQAIERALSTLVQQTLPEIHRSGGRISVPAPASELAGTKVGTQVTNVVKATVGVVHAVVRDAQGAAVREIERARADCALELRRAHTDAREEVARVQATAVRSTEAAVRSVSSALVGMAAKTSRKVSEGVRVHEEDAAFETLTGIDHTVQQMLLVAQGWTLLAGGKLTRHWPATPLTDVVRAAMGSVEDYQRVQHQELAVAVKTRVVGPVVHTLALLLDNALRFSPPHSRVHVSFEQGHHGVTVLVDDSGLRMTPEQLDAARDVLTGQRSDDITQLGARPQTGFRVCALLARTYGFRVDVQAPNALLGTRALLTLPRDLLTTAAPERPVRDTAHAAALTPDPGTRATALSPVLAPASTLTSVPVPDNPLAGLTPARTTASGLTVRNRRAAPAAPPVSRPANATPGRSSVITDWARGTQRARVEPDAPSPPPTPSRDSGMSDKNIGWLLESLEDTAGVEYAVLVAADGMSPAHTDRLPRERAEKISAIASTLWGASRAYDRETNGGGVRQFVMESVGHIHLLIPAGENTMLAVRTDGPHADIGVISEAALRLAASVAQQLGVETRVAGGAQAPLA